MNRFTLIFIFLINCSTQQALCHNLNEQSSQKNCSQVLTKWINLRATIDKNRDENEEFQEKLHDLETSCEFKDCLKQISDQIGIDLENKETSTECSFCMMLRQAYARTAEKDNIPNSPDDL